MAPKYPCPCHKCNSQRALSKRTIEKHCRITESHLSDLISAKATQEAISAVQAHHNQLANLLSGLMEDPYVSEYAESPYQDGKHSILILLFIYF